MRHPSLYDRSANRRRSRKYPLYLRFLLHHPPLLSEFIRQDCNREEYLGRASHSHHPSVVPVRHCTLLAASQGIRLVRRIFDTTTSFIWPAPYLPPSARYEVSPQNAMQWCDLLLRLLDDLEAAFPTVKASRRSRPVPTPPATSIEAAVDVMGVLGLLNDLLVGDVVDHLITRELGYHLSQAYDRTMSTSWTGESRLPIVASSV